MAECSKFIDDFEELVSCGICDDILDIPKTLGCLHTFCLKCLKRWQEQCQTDRKPFNCPICRISIRVQGNDVNNIPTSFQLKSLIELLNTLKEKEANEQQQLSMPCSSCLNHRLLAGCCFQCGGMLCNECYAKNKITERKSAPHVPFGPGLPMDQATCQQDGQIFLPDQSLIYMPPVQQGPRPFCSPQFQQVRPRWNSQQHQLVRVVPSHTGDAEVARGTMCEHGSGSPRVIPSKNRIQHGDSRSMNLAMFSGRSTRPQFKFTHSTRHQKHTPWNHAPRIPEVPDMFSTGQEPLLSTALSTASPQEAKQMLGERIFPFVQQTHPELAGKITGMLLEIDNSELLIMLESREALNAKVQEAIDVLKAYQAKDALAQITLN